MKTIGVIGLGSIGKRHARNLIAMGHRVIGYDPGVMPEDVAINGLTLGSEVDALLTDAFVIASPTRCHADHIRSALPGKPIFCEKPLAHEYDEAFAQVAMVGYMLRFHPCVLKAREWIAAGKIGRPLWAQFTCAQYNDRPAYLREGVISNWSHEIDLALHLLGPAEVASASAAHSDFSPDAINEVMADIVLQHDSGVRSIIHLDYVTRPESRSFYVYGTGGTIGVAVKMRHAIVSDQDGRLLDRFDDRDGSYDADYIAEIQSFLNRIDGHETLGCTGAEGLAALRVILDARKMAGIGDEK